MNTACDASVPVNPDVVWNSPLRVGFRFVFLYSILYSLCYLVASLIPVTVREIVVNPVSIALFGRPARSHPTGSGDTWFDWMTLMVIASASVLGTLVWSLLDRRRANYSRLFAGLLVYLRFAVAFTMVGYGIAKVFAPRQFSPLSPARLIEPLGSMSPMGLMWTFMGHSTPYTIFGGVLEVLGALLLFFRRTTLLGALILAGVMTNVAMMDLAYDVPAKQFALHLVGFCALIAAPHARRLLRFFVLDTERQRRRWLAVVGLGVAALMVCVNGFAQFVRYQQERVSMAAGPYDGIYDVAELTRNGQIVPPLLSEKTRWRRVGIGAGLFGAITVDDTLTRFGMTPNAAATGFTLVDRTGEYPMTATPFAGGLVIEGKLDNAAIRASLRRVNDSQLVLTSRGFHWVQEDPFNR